MSDEELYLEATNDVESENKNQAIWAKARRMGETHQPNFPMTAKSTTEVRYETPLISTEIRLTLEQ